MTTNTNSNILLKPPYDQIENLIGHEVVDKNEVKIGTVDSVWNDNSGQPAFFTVKTWFGFGRTLIVPAYSAQLDVTDQKIRVPYAEEVLREAPTFDPEIEPTSGDEDRLVKYYAGYGLVRPTITTLADVDPVTEPAVPPVATTAPETEFPKNYPKDSPLPEPVDVIEAPDMVEAPNIAAPLPQAVEEEPAHRPTAGTEKMVQTNERPATMSESAEVVQVPQRPTPPLRSRRGRETF